VRSGPQWTEGGADTRHGSVSPMRGAPGTAGLRSLLVMAGEEEGDERCW
jgi:hypothetical protein